MNKESLLSVVYSRLTPKKKELKEAGFSCAYRLWIVTLLNSTSSKNTYIKATIPIQMLLLKEPIVFIVHYVYWVYVCVFCIVFCTVCKYVLSIWSTLLRISLTKALVLWWCDNKSDLIWFDLSSHLSEVGEVQQIWSDGDIRHQKRHFCNYHACMTCMISSTFYIC